MPLFVFKTGGENTMFATQEHDFNFIFFFKVSQIEKTLNFTE